MEKKIRKYIVFWDKCVTYAKRCAEIIEAHKYNKAEPYFGGFKMLIEVLEKCYQPLLEDCLCITRSRLLHTVNPSKNILDRIRKCIHVENKFNDVFFVYMRWASIWTYDLGRNFSKGTACLKKHEFKTENMRLFKIAALFHQIYHRKCSCAST